MAISYIIAYAECVAVMAVEHDRLNRCRWPVKIARKRNEKILLMLVYTVRRFIASRRYFAALCFYQGEFRCFIFYRRSAAGWITAVVFSPTVHNNIYFYNSAMAHAAYNVMQQRRD